VCVRNLFREKPTIEFYPEPTGCCGLDLRVQKTRIKTVFTRTLGEFWARETVLECPQCSGIYTSKKLQELVSPGCNLGYDVLVYAGISLFLNHRNEKEIKAELENRGVTISLRGIAYLARKFIVYLAIAHRQSSAQLKKAMKARGGYILHLDGTCEGDSPHLMSGLDGISELVLDNIKLPSEKAERIIPFLNEIKKTYGIPLALVHDMGKGILSAVKKVFPGARDFICHFHFLRDIGKDLFGKENDIIRNRLRHHGVQGQLRKKAIALKNGIDHHPGLTDALVASLGSGKIEQWALEQAPEFAAYTLIQWALDGKHQGDGYGFPFDRPYLVFYQRLQTLYAQCEKLQQIRLHHCLKDSKTFLKVCRLLQGTMGDRALHTAAEQLQKKAFVFDKLRKAMRIADPMQNRGINDDGEDIDIKTIEKGVKEFRHWLVNSNHYSKNRDYQKMVAQIDKYWEKLFADPITVDTQQGKITIQPQRTNNLLERFFRDIKRRFRKKSGSNSMGKTLQAMLADTPLVKNLENQEYLNILLNGKTTLEALFAEIDAKIVREEMRKTQDESEKIPTKLRRIIKKPQLPQIIVKLFTNHLQNLKHN